MFSFHGNMLKMNVLIYFDKLIDFLIITYCLYYGSIIILFHVNDFCTNNFFTN